MKHGFDFLLGVCYGATAHTQANSEWDSQQEVQGSLDKSHDLTKANSKAKGSEPHAKELSFVPGSGHARRHGPWLQASALAAHGQPSKALRKT